MKRMHIHVGVGSIDDSIRFYSTLFGDEPVKVKPDYAKWELDDPSLNFAISTRSGISGVDHLGIQVEDESELLELRKRLKEAAIPLYDEGEVVCCYSRSEKSWLEDTAGIGWETYHSMDDTQFYSRAAESDTADQCCVEESCC